jgi:hypothetical protein
MASSTSTLLDVANVVYRALGERSVLTLSNTQGDRVKDAIRQACTDVETLHTWGWLQKKVVANTWLTNLARLDTYQRIYGVQIGDTVKGYRELTYVPEMTLDTLPLKPYTGTKDEAQFYTLVEGGVRFNKYPNDSVSRNRILFYVQEPILLPTSDSSVFFNVPQRYISLIEKKACYLMCIRYLDDAQAASYFQQELEQLVQQYRNYERKSPVKRLNIYRGGK